MLTKFRTALLNGVSALAVALTGGPLYQLRKEAQAASMKIKDGEGFVCSFRGTSPNGVSLRVERNFIILSGGPSTANGAGTGCWDDEPARPARQQDSR